MFKLPFIFQNTLQNILKYKTVKTHIKKLHINKTKANQYVIPLNIYGDCPNSVVKYSPVYNFRYFRTQIKNNV